jgi:hypothetical protein
MPRTRYGLAIVVLACLTAALATSALVHALSIPPGNGLFIVYVTSLAFGLSVVGLMEMARQHLRR